MKMQVDGAAARHRDYRMNYTVTTPSGEVVHRREVDLSSPAAMLLDELLQSGGSDRFYGLLQAFGEEVRKCFPIEERTVTYSDFVEAVAGRLPRGTVSRAFTWLVRYAEQNPESLLVICPVCLKHVAERCGHVSPFDRDDDSQSFPRIDWSSLMALTLDEKRYYNVYNFGTACRVVVSYVIDHIRD